MPDNFTDIESLKTHIQNKETGCLTVSNRLLEAYEGMALNIGIIFDVRQDKYELDMEWIAYGLDLFGENLLENYLYTFESLEKVLEYLSEKYDIEVSDIPVTYSFNSSHFPNPIKDEARKPAYEEAWKRFQEDFSTRAFLDTSLTLVYDTHDLS